MISIRPYRPSDRDGVARVCVLTGDSGLDASGHYSSDELLPDVYALPYVDREPGLAFVVDDGTGIVGYIIATADTREFARWFDAEWWPSVAPKYSGDERDASLLAAAADPERMLVPELADYPAHLHIDVLPEAQGGGLGRRLVETLVDALLSSGVRGLHLVASATNTRARAFYDRIGFSVLPSSDDAATVMGMRLDPAKADAP